MSAACCLWHSTAGWSDKALHDVRCVVPQAHRLSATGRAQCRQPGVKVWAKVSVVLSHTSCLQASGVSGPQWGGYVGDEHRNRTRARVCDRLQA
jgi:hypothetical protein